MSYLDLVKQKYSKQGDAPLTKLTKDKNTPQVVTDKTDKSTSVSNVSTHIGGEKSFFDLNKLIEQACAGLKITPAEVLADMAPEDIEETLGGWITPKQLRCYVECLNRIEQI